MTEVARLVLCMACWKRQPLDKCVLTQWGYYCRDGRCKESK